MFTQTEELETLTNSFDHDFLERISGVSTELARVGMMGMRHGVERASRMIQSQLEVEVLTMRGVG